MENIVLCLCLFTFGIISAKPFPHNAWQGQSPFPKSSLMLSGYYGRSRLSASPNYYPQGLMTAFASGDTISTNSFLGNDEYNPVLDDTLPELPEQSDEIPHQQEILPVETTESANEEETTPKRVPKRNKTQKPPLEADEEEDDEPNFFTFGKGGRKPSYNAFFPIMIGGYPGSAKTGGSEGYGSGSATAIANSFSTGRGGVASSHATSFGDPYLSMLFRKSFSNRKNPLLKEE